MHVESNKTKTFRPLLLCMINTPHGLSEYTNIWVHPIKTFLWQHILRIPFFFYIRPKNRLHFYTPCQILVINLDKTSSMAKFSWSFVRWAMLQTVNWVILPNGMMKNTLQLIMPQVCHITCSAILPPTYPNIKKYYICQSWEKRHRIFTLIHGLDLVIDWNLYTLMWAGNYFHSCQNVNNYACGHLCGTRGKMKVGGVFLAAIWWRSGESWHEWPIHVATRCLGTEHTIAWEKFYKTFDAPMFFFFFKIQTFKNHYIIYQTVKMRKISKIPKIRKTSIFVKLSYWTRQDDIQQKRFLASNQPIGLQTKPNTHT